MKLHVLALLFATQLACRKMIAADAKTLPHRSEYIVQGLEDVEPAFAQFDGTMYAGLIPYDNGDRKGSYMFWLFHPTDAPNALIMWLNGGPGCSSFSAGLSFENSPVTTVARPAGVCCGSRDDPYRPNPYAWTRAGSMLYVEQPAGTGFSTGPEPMTEDDVSGDMYAFLQNFFDIFLHLRPTPFFIFGESYAGMYVPSIAHWIHQQNRKVASSDRLINLEGIALGNGWMDAMTQGPAVIDYAWFHGMIDSHTKALLHEEWNFCASGSNKLDGVFHPFTIPDECGIMAAVLNAAGQGLLEDRNPNTYDVTTFDTYPVIDIYDPDTTINIFYNSDKVKKALHAPMDILWRGCIPGSGRRLMRNLLMLDNDRPMSTAPYLATLMDEGNVRVLVYNGDRDLSTNSAGTELVLDQITEWSGHDAWKTATRGLWLFQQTEMAGWAKQLQHLTFLVVYNSGHMVPYNLPPQALDLVQRFVTNSSFVDRKIELFVPSRSRASKGIHKKGLYMRKSTLWCIIVAGIVAVVALCLILRHSRRQDYQLVGTTDTKA
jgi:carboxypeptidase C (cathepsin A)